MKIILLLFLIPHFALTAPPKILTSFSILADITKNIVPADFSVSSIVPAGMDSHGYQTTAKDFLLFKKADLILLVGENFEPWAQTILTKTSTSAYYVTKNMALIPQNEKDHHSHKTQFFDPHIWQSPRVVIQVINALSEVLILKFPHQKNEIKKKTHSYILQIQKIQNKYLNEFNKLNPTQKKMIVAHNSFQYFANEYGVVVYSPVETGQEGESSLQAVTELISKIKTEKIQNIFLEKSAPLSLMNSISKSTKVPIAGILYSDCLSDGDPVPTYLKMIDYNFSLILKSMKGPLP